MPSLTADTPQAHTPSQETVSPLLTQATEKWQAAGASLIQAFLTTIPLLEERYIFREEPEVVSFLEAHVFLIPLLQEIFPKIKRHFPEARVFLEVFVDLEGDEGDKLLIVLAVKGSEADEFIDRLHQLYQDGWITLLRKVQGKLGITLESP
jgi:hypothetical protein